MLITNAAAVGAVAKQLLPPPARHCYTDPIKEDVVSSCYPYHHEAEKEKLHQNEDNPNRAEQYQRGSISQKLELFFLEIQVPLRLKPFLRKQWVYK